MSLAANSIAEMPIGGDRTAGKVNGKTPPSRTVTANADPVQQPEAR